MAGHQDLGNVGFCNLRAIGQDVVVPKKGLKVLFNVRCFKDYQLV